MSVHRLCLRLAAAVALTNNAAAPWPTAAEKRVFEGRIEPIDGMFTAEPRPLILIETPVHENGIAGQKIKDASLVDLVFDLGIALNIAAEGQPFEIGVPQSDSEIDTALDLLEAQVHRALARSDIFQSVCQGIHSVSSVLAPAEDGQRAAIRYLRYQCAVLRDVYNGQVPAGLALLLAALAENPEYSERAGAINAFLTQDSGTTETIVAMLDRKWSADAAGHLGGWPGAPVQWPAEMVVVTDPASVAEQPPGGLAP